MPPRLPWSFPALFVLAAPRPSGAGCNLTPGTEKTFNGVLGATNRPYAGPGEMLQLRLRPCDDGRKYCRPD